MPTYEYACLACGAHVEVYQRFSDEPLTECGVCEGPLRKVFHPAGILFKGSGFYKTDSRSVGRPSDEKPEPKEAKPAAAAEAAPSDAGTSKTASGAGAAAKEKTA